MVNEKCFVLDSGYVRDFETKKSWAWGLGCWIQRNGTFHHKGQFYFSRRGIGNQKRSVIDRSWFRWWLGDEYMKQFVIHHDKNGYCFLITEKEHKMKHGGVLSLMQ